ncbi:MAG: myo-inositol 2-dehydrogenase [Anaerolineales bacterium]|nr:myo-inositol 2-dehydrogenase [Anaerolineales bacterium]
MTQNTLNIGVIGAGRIGRVHSEHLATRIPGVRLAAIADVNLPAAESLAGQFHATPHQDYRRILDDPTLQAVAICSATDTHARLIVEAAQAGKHIFCEKPIDYDLQKIDAALAAAERAGVKLMIGFNRRFDPNFRKVRELVGEGKVGNVHLLRITSRDPAPPPVEYVRVSGGMFLDMTIHDFDMACYLTGSEVVEVFAAGGVLIDPAIGAAGDIDTALVTLKFANGAMGAIDNSRKAVYGYDQRVEVFGSAGMVSVSNNTPDRHVLSDAQGVHAALPLYFFMQRYTESFIAEMTEFVQCLQKDTAPPVTGRDGRRPVVIGLAAQKSLRENRPVRVSEIE